MSSHCAFTLYQVNKQVFKALATYDVNRHQYPTDAKRQGGSAFGNVNARF
ncbi:uncharacterized protein G6M90_00g049140 [Metarhizium brunneum]|uniref:Uncharacterized protein n=1 Tax=Metarhizium brunneum TaxID=500148 RepID=A0A7D5UUC9_9HYPO|nr:hypothetical protein G6M90_00g049140 [Metarhizium brunneum]